MSDWVDELFNEESRSHETEVYAARKLAVYLVRNSVDTHENKERLISWLEDERVEITADEIQDFLVAVRINQMSPRENANMGQREINEWVKTAMALDRSKNTTNHNE
jgi:hypothetical protein